MGGTGDAVRAKINDAEAGPFRAFVEKRSGVGRTDAFGRVGEPASPATMGVYLSQNWMSFMQGGRGYLSLKKIQK